MATLASSASVGSCSPTQMKLLPWARAVSRASEKSSGDTSRTPWW